MLTDVAGGILLCYGDGNPAGVTPADNAASMHHSYHHSTLAGTRSFTRLLSHNSLYHLHVDQWSVAGEPME